MLLQCRTALVRWSLFVQRVAAPTSDFSYFISGPSRVNPILPTNTDRRTRTTTLYQTTQQGHPSPAPTSLYCTNQGKFFSRATSSTPVRPEHPEHGPKPKTAPPEQTGAKSAPRPGRALAPPDRIISPCVDFFCRITQDSPYMLQSRQASSSSYYSLSLPSSHPDQEPRDPPINVDIYTL